MFESFTVQHVAVVLQAITSLSIAGGLIYTAVQFRRARQAQHVANFTRLVELQMQLRRMRVDDPSLAAVYRHDVIDLHSAEEIRQYFFNLMQLSVYEIVWFSYQHGQLPEKYFKSWEKRVRDIASEPTFRRMMQSPSMKILHDDFQMHVENLVREVAPLPPVDQVPIKRS